MTKWFGRGFYDDMVTRAGELIGDRDADKVDPRVFYWRGLAFFRLGWLPEATEDLTYAQKMGLTGQNGGLDVAATLAKIQRLSELMPSNYREIKSGGQVVFRVHYTQLDPMTRTIVGLLPQAYRISENLYGSDVLATSVYIFNSYAQFRAFYMARSGSAPGSWVWAAGSRDAFYFSLQGPDGRVPGLDDPDYVRSTIAHEFNHAMLSHLMGTTEIPRWFEEGIAQIAGAQLAARDIPLNDYEIARLYAAGALVDPAKLEAHASFGAHTELGVKMDRAGAGIAAPSPYAESYHMTRYLMSNLKRGQLADFLNRVREQGDFAQAFQQEFGATLPQFYQSWYQDTARKLKG